MRSLKKSSVINLVSQQISKTKEEVSTYLLILSLHVNGLNCSIQRCRLAEWIKKKKRIQWFAGYKKFTSLAKIYID
jgi:hypothetical protein